MVAGAQIVVLPIVVTARAGDTGVYRQSINKGDLLLTREKETLPRLAGELSGKTLIQKTTSW